VLRGVTTQELRGLSDRYDSGSSGGRTESSGLNSDEVMKQKLDSARQLDYTGYPPDVFRFEMSLGDTQARLAALPPETRDYYAGRLAALEIAYRNMTSKEARSVIEGNAAELEDAILQEYNRSINDPLDHALSVFNHPLGEGYIPASRSKDLAKLDQLRNAFLNAPDAASREAIFREAAQLKKGLQQAASDGVDAYVKADKAAWDDAYKYVDLIIHDAEKIQDPVKRYKAIGDGLFSLNTGMGEDPVADRRVLAFTQRMRDDDNLRQKLDTWQVAAGEPLNKDGAGAPVPYSRMLSNPPPAGADYVRDLSDQYTDVLRKTTQSEDLAHANRIKPYIQVLEGVARFLLALTPLAPLSSAFDEHSSLSTAARLGIDIGALVLSSLLDPFLGAISAEGKDAALAARLSEDATEASQPAKDAGMIAEHNSGDTDTAANVGGEPQYGRVIVRPTAGGAADETGNATAHYQPVSDGPSPDPRLLAAKARMNGNALQVPEDYIVQPDPNTLTADENAAGVFADEQGQHYIKNGEHYYNVTYDPANNTWRVVNPQSPVRYTYPVHFDPATGSWSINSDIGLRGGGSLSRLVSLKQFMKDPTTKKLVESKVLKPQNPQTCFLDHSKVAQAVAGAPSGRPTIFSYGPLTGQQLIKALDKGPLVLSARGIARPDSGYSGMHTVVLLKVVNEDGKLRIIGVDLDDTIAREGSGQDVASGDFGGVEYDPDALAAQATPYVDPDSGTQLEMYQRPQRAKEGFWKWL
jgi:hypothetical protein